MRVIAGEWRGRPLVAPPGQSTRPTADRVRESLFSMLASRMGPFEGLSVADLYSGSGALGIEALRKNLDALKAPERARIVNSRVESFVSAQPLQLIFADPPYAAGSGSAVVALAAKGEWLAPGGWMAVETARGDSVDPGAYSLEAERDIGRARVTLLRNG